MWPMIVHACQSQLIHVFFQLMLMLYFVSTDDTDVQCSHVSMMVNGVYVRPVLLWLLEAFTKRVHSCRLRPPVCGLSLIMLCAMYGIIQYVIICDLFIVVVYQIISNICLACPFAQHPILSIRECQMFSMSNQSISWTIFKTRRSGSGFLTLCDLRRTMHNMEELFIFCQAEVVGTTTMLPPTEETNLQ